MNSEILDLSGARASKIMLEDVRLYQLILREKLDLRSDLPIPARRPRPLNRFLVRRPQDREERAWNAATGPKTALRAWLVGLENAAVAAWLRDEAGRAALSALAVRCTNGEALERLAMAAKDTDRVDGGVVSAKLLRCIEEIRALPELLGPPEEPVVNHNDILPNRRWTSADPVVSQALAVFGRYSEVIDEAWALYN